MSGAPRRCLRCGLLNESYVATCGCGFALDGTAGRARDELGRDAAVKGWATILGLVIALVATAAWAALALHDVADPGQRRTWASFLVFGGIAGIWLYVHVVRAFLAWRRARALLAALPELPSARAVRRG
ncbi:MAG: hypothetical protein KBG48_30290 [Kofleriaceae bacterium]|jgi:hypothetical protein|nr:hypothetical protein [Kofleriaceae bacterium]MBP9856317.1 hypothetical protein [Kofleriaceae bacterium]